MFPSLMKGPIINNVLVELAKELDNNNEIFLSEADLQFSFAKKLMELYRDAKIILEYPILTCKLYENTPCCQKYIKENYRDNCKDKDCKFRNDRTYIDLYFELGNEKYFIEFKYKLEEIGEVNRHNCCKTILKKQGAEYIGRHHVYEDIERMENIIKIQKVPKNVKAYVIMITNDESYWGKNQKEGQTTYNFPLANIKETTTTTKYGELTYKTSATKPPRTLHIEKSYKIEWSKFITLDKVKNEVFNVLQIDCSTPIK